MSFQTFITQQHLTEQLRATTTFKIAAFLPSIIEACEKYIYPALSKDFAMDIVNGVETDTTVVDLTRGAMICFASELYFNMGGVNTGPEGFSENVSSDQKPTRLEVLSIAQASRAEAGHIKMDILLKYLEEKVSDTKFVKWKQSEAFQMIDEFPISNTNEFDKFCRIRQSRSIFLALRPAMNQAMMMDIQEVIDSSDTATFTTIQQKTFNLHIKNALANLAYGYGIFDLATTFGFDTILSFSNLNASRQKGYQNVQKELLEEIEKRKFALGKQSLTKAIDMIAANSPQPEVEENQAYKNDPNSHVVYF